MASPHMAANLPVGLFSEHACRRVTTRILSSNPKACAVACLLCTNTVPCTFSGGPNIQIEGCTRLHKLCVSCYHSYVVLRP